MTPRPEGEMMLQEYERNWLTSDARNPLKQGPGDLERIRVGLLAIIARLTGEPELRYIMQSPPPTPAPSGGTKRHELKTWPEQFEGVLSGKKRHEFRRDDRGFRVGDTLLLREFTPCPHCNGSGKVWDSGDTSFCRECDAPHGSYSGREIVATVEWVTRTHEWGGAAGFVCLSIATLTPPASAPGSGEEKELLPMGPTCTWLRPRESSVSPIDAAINAMLQAYKMCRPGNVEDVNEFIAARESLLAAVARARAEGEAKGRRQALAWMYRCRYPHLDELRIAERVMRDLAALADDEGRGT